MNEAKTKLPTGHGFTEAQCSAASPNWTQKPPDKDGQGYWWWWNGDCDCYPTIIQVAVSGSNQMCFVCYAHDRLTRWVDHPRWNGWWKPIAQEQPPNEKVSDAPH